MLGKFIVVTILYWHHVDSKISCFASQIMSFFMLSSSMFVLSFLLFLVCMSIVTCRSYSFPKATSGPDQGQPIADSDQTILPSDRAGKCEVFDPCVFSCI